MENWRKSVAAKYSSKSKAFLPRNTKRYNDKENSSLLRSRGKSYGESPNIGSRWMANKVRFANRKSIPRRLSFQKDDSIIQMNMGGTEQAPSSSLDTSHHNFSVNEESTGIKKETLDYLKSLGILPRNARQESTAQEKPDELESSAKEVVQSNHVEVVQSNHVEVVQSNHIEVVQTLTVPDIKLVQSEPNLSTLLFSIKEIALKHSIERQELRERYQKEMEELDKKHEKELMDVFSSPVETNVTEPIPPAWTDNSTPVIPISPNSTLLQDSFLRTPCSGSWVVSRVTDDISANNTPTLGLNSILNDMNLNGQQFTETPATRRMVTQRILQGIESLFVEK